MSDTTPTNINTDFMIMIMKGKSVKGNQHCTSKKCPYTFAHTAQWCMYNQTKRCKCAYCTNANASMPVS